ncbi:MAG: hypothetical protein CYG60_15940 [Actinobacteria bacterium]|nr:MAG: hypothetical protein CYG60_15940 [Actinomycetota bacterium]
MLVVLFILAFLWLLAFLWFVPELQVRHFGKTVAPEDVPALTNEYRRTWAQIIGGFFVLLGLYFTWRRIEIARQELEATRDQQVTERFTRAIDQLGATDDKGKKRLEIRLGGIYALERIAGDSLRMEDSPGRDYATIMEVLTAYVRQNAPWPPEPSEEGSSSPAAAASSDTAPDEGAAGGNGGPEGSATPPAPSKPPPADVQAILDVLGRREEDRVPERYRVPLDLHGTSLLQARLEGANLQGANLQGANLQGANLQGAILLEVEGLTQEQIESARGDETTKLPDGLRPPVAWSKSTDEQPNREE